MASNSIPNTPGGPNSTGGGSEKSPLPVIGEAAMSLSSPTVSISTADKDGKKEGKQKDENVQQNGSPYVKNQDEEMDEMDHQESKAENGEPEGKKCKVSETANVVEKENLEAVKTSTTD